MSGHVALRLLRIGNERITPGDLVPASLDRGRLLTLLRQGAIAPAEGIPDEPAPAPAPAPEPFEGSTLFDDDGDDTPTEFPAHTGGGWYVLSNGDRVQGRDDAAMAQELLDDEG